MYKIGIAAAAYMDNGACVVAPLDDAAIRSGSRRVSRTKTLDGGVVVSDSGYADGDRTLVVRLNSTAALWDTLWRIFRYASGVIVSTHEGCYSANIRTISDQDSVISLEILINTKLSE